MHATWQRPPVSRAGRQLQCALPRGRKRVNLGIQLLILSAMSRWQHPKAETARAVAEALPAIKTPAAAVGSTAGISSWRLLPSSCIFVTC
jgi:hypothetical protein